MLTTTQAEQTIPEEAKDIFLQQMESVCVKDSILIDTTTETVPYHIEGFGSKGMTSNNMYINRINFYVIYRLKKTLFQEYHKSLSIKLAQTEAKGEDSK